MLHPKVQQQRPRSPERNPQPPKEQQQGSSLSSYLQQIHDSQYEQAQQSRFSQGKTRFIFINLIVYLHYPNSIGMMFFKDFLVFR